MTEQLKSKTKRVKRLHLEQAGPLYIDPKYNREGFVRRIVKDIPGNLQRFERMGYTIVRDDTKIGEGKAGDKSQLGSAVTVELGRKNQLTGVLMEIPTDIHKEIQDEKNEIYDRALQMKK